MKYGTIWNNNVQKHRQNQQNYKTYRKANGRTDAPAVAMDGRTDAPAVASHVPARTFYAHGGGALGRYKTTHDKTTLQGAYNANAYDAPMPHKRLD
jgi:hypothetical protein